MEKTILLLCEWELNNCLMCILHSIHIYLIRACFHCVKSLDSNLTNSRHSIVFLVYTHKERKIHFTIRSLCQWNMHDAPFCHCKECPRSKRFLLHTFQIIRNFIRLIQTAFIYMKRFRPLKTIYKPIYWFRIFPTNSWKWTSLSRYYRGLNKA